MYMTAKGLASMNSHRWPRPGSLASGISLIRIRMLSMMAFLYSKPPSSRSTLLRKFISARYFCTPRSGARSGRLCRRQACLHKQVR